MPEGRRSIGEILVDMGVVTPDQLKEVLADQKKTSDKKIGQLLIERNLATREDITFALAEQFELEMVDIDGIEIDKGVIAMVPRDLARQHNIIPIEKADGVLTVAMSDPLDLFTLDNLRFVINMAVEPVLATEESIKNAITRYYGIQEDEVDTMLQELTESNITYVDTMADDMDTDSSTDDAPVIKLVTLIITEAVRARASDIHVEPMPDRLRIRYRIDGLCSEAESAPKRLQGSILSRIKLMAGMDIAEKRRPQDGRIKLSVYGREIDLRVSCIPTTQGESIVMRILDREALLLGLDQLGLHPTDYAILHGLIQKPNGIILVTGPTGSGKTTTLYAALQELNKPSRKIITAEEPVEYNISGINQSQVSRKVGLTFERILRAMLRQAPEIILVGEIRDRETAEAAIQAALTGHLVFSTLHTNDAPSAIMRLVNMGVPKFLVASSIQAILAQRLVRMICPECKAPTQPDIPRLRALGVRDDQIEGHTFYAGAGCDSCNGQGYRGRRAIYEILVMNKSIRTMTFNGETTDKIRDQAIKDGMHTLVMDGIRKVMAGESTAEEVLSVAKASD